MMQYDRTVLAYHGCDLKTAKELLEGEPFQPSENDYDWLGNGVYFWEHGQDRAYQFAEFQKSRGKIQNPAVVGALLQLGRCFDLMDTRFTRDLSSFFPIFRDELALSGKKLPENRGKTPDLKLRTLDCAVLNTYLKLAEEDQRPYDTVRCGFTEGEPVYPGAMIYQETHIQIAVRNPDCIIGLFRPMSHREKLKGERHVQKEQK